MGSRTVTVWQCWDGADAATADSFFATKAEALAHLRQGYDVTPDMLKPDGIITDCWSCSPSGDDNAPFVYLRKHVIPLNGAGIAKALTNLPNR